MVGVKSLEVGCVQYELEIQINAPVERVWNAIVKETNGWWLADFHMVASSSTVEFDIEAGGRGLVEHREDGSFLQWYVVQSYLPDQHKMYLVGNVAPDFGGPSTSNLCLSVEARGDGSVLRVSDAHHGRIDEKYINSLKSGWHQLFDEGLRRYIEA